MFVRLFHWGPLLAIGIVKCITYSTLQVASMCFTPFSTNSGIFCYSSFLLSVGLTLYHFFCAALIGPGYTPQKWTPNDPDDSKFLQKCLICEGFKPPRAHHCRKCNRCVMKMDHHCPWINNCCGHKNHAHFTSFLVFAVLGSFQSSIYLSIGLYRALNYRYYMYYLNSRNVAYFSLYHLVFTIFCLGLALGVVLALSGLFLIQMKSILKNETNIESWIVKKAHGRRERPPPPPPPLAPSSTSTEERGEGPGQKEDRLEKFVYPYDLGKWENFKFVFLTKGTDGIHWPIKEGCHHYTLTIEQLEQKCYKKANSAEYRIIDIYSGSIFPISKGIRTCCTPPCSDEPRLPLNPGDTVLVSRWKRRWLYGEKIKQGPGDNSKGWFPRICAAEFFPREEEEKKCK